MTSMPRTFDADVFTQPEGDDAALVCHDCGGAHDDCRCVVTCAACRAPEWRELAADGLCASCARAAARDRRTQGGYLADPLAHLPEIRS